MSNSKNKSDSIKNQIKSNEGNENRLKMEFSEAGIEPESTQISSNLNDLEYEVLIILRTLLVKLVDSLADNPMDPIRDSPGHISDIPAHHISADQQKIIKDYDRMKSILKGPSENEHQYRPLL
ncbi:hypothetical protein [Bacillus cereus]|uniref:hypothetical protein n=1 Tax=Bacillus cereus TaxID=1396 RepID=UPI0013D411F4|nr:hypothetical protein [Bacillus cereus]